MQKSNNKIILGIETSCDDTGIAIIKVSRQKNKTHYTVLANEISSQIALHQQYGGVFPMMAKREHARNIVPLFIHALTESGLLKERKRARVVEPKINTLLQKVLIREPEILETLSYFLEKYELPKIDMITVTVGPGLEPTLWVGINFAQALGKILGTPVVPTNHMEGHILSVLIPEELKVNSKHETRSTKQKFTLADSSFKFPALALLVSGGHTELVLIKDIGKYKVIGATRDDAAGEAFDKIARMLDLPYPGGPEIARLAHEGRTTLAFTEFSLPRPMLHSGDFDFSFSGLKTAVLYTLRDNGKLSDMQKKDLARECEDAIIEVLTTKTLRAVQKYNIQTLIVGGGVSANTQLRKELPSRLKLVSPNTIIHFPTKLLSRDNALMIALAGYLLSLRKKKFPKALKAEGNLNL